MNPERGAALATVTLIALATVASGPAFPAEFTPAGESGGSLYGGFAAGGGVDVERQLGVAPQPLPTDPTLTEADGAYAVAVPDAELAVAAGADPATVTYRLSVPALAGTWTVTRTVAPGTTADLALALDGTTATAADAARDRYAGTLSLRVESGDTAFTARERNVTVGVAR